MSILLALLAAAPVFAAEPPLKPRIAAENENPAGPPYSMSGLTATVSIWDARKGRQLALVDMPDMERNDSKDDGISSSVHSPNSGFAGAVSADGKWAVAPIHKHRWKKNFGGLTGKYAVYLISVPEQKVVRKLYESEWSPVGDVGIVGRHPSLMWAELSDDGAHILTRAITDWTAQGRRVKTLSVLSRSGAVEFRQSYPETEQNDAWVSGTPIPILGFLRDGRPILVSADYGGCMVRDLKGARISFLEGCSERSAPVIERGMVWSRAKDYSVWEPETGRLKYKKPLVLPEGLAAPAEDFSSVAVVEYSSTSTRARVKVYDAASGLVASKRELELPVLENEVEFVQYDARAGVLTMSASHGEKFPYTSETLVFNLGAAPLAVAAPEQPAIDVDAPPASKAKRDPDAYAVVIGVEKYRQDGIPAVDYAARDASTVYAYLTQSMGFDAKNVVLLTDEHATRTDFEKNLGKWLQNRVTEKSRVFVYYAGHGAPNPASGEGYLMPYEADPNYVEDTAYPVAKLYAALGKLPTKDVTVVLDACFSGQGGRSLIAKGARPLVLVKAAQAAGNTVVLAAASSSQISAADPQRRHGLLTEYLLEALHGAADTRGDGKITADEIYAYVRPAVERAARLQNIEQTPTMAPAPQKGGRPWIVLK